MGDFSSSRFWHQSCSALSDSRTFLARSLFCAARSSTLRSEASSLWVAASSLRCSDRSSSVFFSTWSTADTHSSILARNPWKSSPTPAATASPFFSRSFILLSGFISSSSVAGE